MLEANIPIHFFTSYKSAMPAAPRKDTASVQRELQENPESLWCYYSLLSHTNQCIHIKRIQKVYHLVGSLLSSVLRYKCTRHCILKWPWLPELWRTQHPPILPHSPAHPHTQHTRRNQNTNVWEGGVGLTCEEKGERRQRGTGGRVRERGREGDEGESKYKLLCTSA